MKKMTDKPYPFTWTAISQEEKDERAKMWNGPASVMVDMVRCDQMNVLVPKAFVDENVDSWPRAVVAAYHRMQR